MFFFIYLKHQKIKKTFGSDFLDLGDGQYSSTRYSNKKPKSKDCSYCLKSDGEIHFCKYCRLRGHESCFQANLGVSREGYKNKVVICQACRNNCEICDKTDKFGQLFFCSRCASVFHKACDPNLGKLSTVQFGEWQCSFCDTLDSLVGDSLTEEQRRKEINRRKLLAMRKRLRKSDYVLEDGLCSIQQIVSQAVKKRKLETEQSNQDDKNKKIELSEDELDNSKHILNETQVLDFWLDDDLVDFVKLEDFLKKQRKTQNILSKHIKEDKKYYQLVKAFIDHLKDDKFDCKKTNFLKVLNSDLFKRAFFEQNSLNGLTKGSTFLEGLTKCIEKRIQNEYWKTDAVDDNSMNEKEYFTKQIQNRNDSSDLTKSSIPLEEPTAISVEKRIPIINDTSNDEPTDRTNESNVKESKIVEIAQQPVENDHASSPNANEIHNSDVEDVEEFDDQEQLVQYKLYLQDEQMDEGMDAELNDLEDEESKLTNEFVDELKCDEPNLNDLDDRNVDKVSNMDNELSELNSNQQPITDQPTKEQQTSNELNQSENIEEESDPSDKLSLETTYNDRPVTVKEDLVKVDLLSDNLVEEHIPDDDLCDLMCDESINDRTINDEICKEAVCQENEANTNEENKDKNAESGSGVSNSNIQSEQSTDKESETSNKPNNDLNKPTDSSANRPNKSDNTSTNDESVEQQQPKDVQTDKLVNELNKVELNSNKSHSSSTSGSSSRPVSQNSQKSHRSTRKKSNKASKQSKSSKQKLKIKPSNNLVDKLFKRACKYNLSLLEPKFWSTEDVSIYLKQLGFENEAQCFKEKSIDGRTLLKLSRQEVLNNFGIRLGPAVKLYAYVYDLQIKNKCNITFD